MSPFCQGKLRSFTNNQKRGELLVTCALAIEGCCAEFIENSGTYIAIPLITLSARWSHFVQVEANNGFAGECQGLEEIVCLMK
jgi:hypothetical protein